MQRNHPRKAVAVPIKDCFRTIDKPLTVTVDSSLSNPRIAETIAEEIFYQDTEKNLTWPLEFTLFIEGRDSYTVKAELTFIPDIEARIVEPEEVSA